MKRHNYKAITTILPIIFSGWLMYSCSLDMEPENMTPLSEALNTPANLEAALISVYANLRSADHYGRDMFAKADALADVTLATNNSGRFVAENRNDAGAHFSTGFWENSYFSIGEINRILAQIEKGVNGATPEQLRRWEGESKFLRALYLFDLVKVYAYIPTAIFQEGLVDQGGVPMPLSPVYDLENVLFGQDPRATIEQNYDQIILDLKDAIDLLEESERPVPQFASTAAAYALLSRVALYKGDWEMVVTASTTALSLPVGQLVFGMNYINGWKNPVNPESIFEVRFHDNSESLGSTFSLQSAFTTLLDVNEKNRLGGWGDLIPSPKILEAFGLSQLQTGNPASNNNNWDVTRNLDIRANLFTTGSNQRPNGRQIECVKFLGKNGFNYGDNIPVIRKSEMLLNRMEANFHLGKETEAFNEFVAFKIIKGLSPSILTGEELLEDILNERLKEFAFEGQRFFDLKRYGRAIDKSDYLGPDAIVPFEDFRILAPIPSGVVENNRNINQNRGY